MSREMRDKVLLQRVRAARLQVKRGDQIAGGWADVYAKDVAALRSLLTRFVIAETALAIAQDKYPGPLRAQQELSKIRRAAAGYLGRRILWFRGENSKSKEADHA